MVTIRDGRWPDDRDAALGFIDGLQRYERAVEPNRRIDGAVATEYFDVLMAAVKEHGGIVRVAESGGRAVGWAVAWRELDPLYVVEEMRPHLYISELYVEESLRGSGIGLALIASCEEWGRAQGLAIAKIGVLAANTRAAQVYARAGFAPQSAKLVKRLD